ncbi:high affinity copper transporter [Lasiosphaeria ovina]|uniref:Copper transport protein n=1 Tax=Lasiosphaeria ovina TaxID=92902 RepID=A0AAE0TYF4_9PEZI|nr:high affinity copper transporter [Lasiosphaeria ovina]
MDMGDMTMPAGTATSAVPAATATATMSMDDMSMGGGSCKISMLWNWYTVDSCFISSTWRVTSRGAFAGSCIGVILLVVLLESLRRAVKEYDRYLLRQHAASRQQHGTLLAGRGSSAYGSDKGGRADTLYAADAPAPTAAAGFRPSVLQQAVRALLHMAQFAVAYFIMLLAMYYNGYIIICIFIGAYIGSFIFHWETLGGNLQTSAAQEATVCCG